MVTADCADERCVCATSEDTQCPSSAKVQPDDDKRFAAKLPVDGAIVFQLEPIVRSLASEQRISVSKLPADLGYSEGPVDSVTQADPQLKTSSSWQSPRLARENRRSPSNPGNARFAHELVKASPPIDPIESGSQAALEVEVEVQAPASDPRIARPKSIMQDSYIVFGVNGR